MWPDFKRVCVSVVSLSLVVLSWTSMPSAETRLTLLFSMNDATLPSTSDAWVRAFDISPDGNALAVTFAAAESEQAGGTSLVAKRVGVWDLRTKRLVSQQRVEGPAPGRELTPNAQYTNDIRFTPDGRRLVVQTGLQVHVLSAANLVPQFSIARPELRPAPPEGAVIRRFSISGDGKWLIVVSNAATFECQPSNFRLFRIETGERVADWALPQACVKSVSLSWDGDRVLLGDFDSEWPPDADVLIVDSRTGRIARSVDAGYYGHGPLFGVNEVEMIGKDRFVTLANVSRWAPTQADHTLKLWDLRTGQLLHQLRYSMYGIVGDSVAVARDAPVIAAITGKRDPARIGRDDGTDIGFSELLLFHLDDREPFYVSPTLNGTVLMFSPSDTPVRLSANGRVVAFMQGTTVEVYDVRDEAGPARLQR